MWPILFGLNLVEVITMPPKITYNFKTNMASYNIAVIPLLMILTLQWRHNELGGVWNHQPHDCLLTCLFRRRSRKTSKLRVTGICEGISPVTGEFPAQRASNTENVSHDDVLMVTTGLCYAIDIRHGHMVLRLATETNSWSWLLRIGS